MVQNSSTDRDVLPLLWSALRLLGLSAPKYPTPKHLNDAFRRKNTLWMQEMLLKLTRMVFGPGFQNEVRHPLPLSATELARPLPCTLLRVPIAAACSLVSNLCVLFHHLCVFTT